MTTLRTAWDPTINFTPRERLARTRETLTMELARRLPYRLRYWTFITFATAHIADDEVVPAVTVSQILRRARDPRG